MQSLKIFSLAGYGGAVSVLALNGQRQEGLFEFKASPVYMSSKANWGYIYFPDWERKNVFLIL